MFFSDPQKQMNLQIDDSLERAQDALRACDRRLSELKIQVDEQLAQVANWTAFRDRWASSFKMFEFEKNTVYWLIAVSCPHKSVSYCELRHDLGNSDYGTC